MLLHTDRQFLIYFGAAQDRLKQSEYLALPDAPILGLQPFAKLKSLMHLDSLMFLHQTHSAQGITVDNNALASIAPFKLEGDFLTTQRRHTGIGVMTADCLPVVIHDVRNNVISIVHAGWRGAVKGVVMQAIRQMQEQHQTHVEDVTVLFGPSAKACCYKVDSDFRNNLEGFYFADRVLQQRGNDYFFDLPGFSKIQLEALAIKPSAINLTHNSCTICDSSFHSHRRDGQSAGRQMTVVCLV